MLVKKQMGQSEMKTRTHFAHRIELLNAVGEIQEHLAGVEDYLPKADTRCASHRLDSGRPRIIIGMFNANKKSITINLKSLFEGICTGQVSERGAGREVVRAEPMSTLDAELNDFGAQLAILGGHAADRNG